MFKKGNALKTARITLSVILLSVFILGFIARDIFAQNQDCPSCPKKDEQKQEPNQPQPKEYMVGDLKVIETPSKYSREELEKMFPVPEQWKEWYRLEKEGKLPKYVKIIDIYQWEIDHCKLINSEFGEDKPCKIDMSDMADDFLDHKYKSDHLDLEWYKNIMARRGEAGCRVLAGIVSEEGHTYYPLFPILVKCLQEEPEKAYYLGQAIINIIHYYKSHPGFYENTINDLKKFIPVFWGLLKNTGKYSNNKDVILWIQTIAADVLYLLDENLENLTEYIKHNKIPAYPSSYYNDYTDVLNNRRIEYGDIRLASFFKTVLSDTDPKNQYLAINYFIKLDCYEEYIDTIVKFCKNNFNSFGIQVFEGITIKNNKIPKIIDIAEYFIHNINKAKIDDYGKKSLLSWIKKMYNLPKK